jgi:hypothetical protein
MRNACGAFYEIPNGNRFLTQCLQCNRHGRKAVIWTPVSRKEAAISALPSHSNCLGRRNRPARGWSHNRECLLGREVDGFERR